LTSKIIHILSDAKSKICYDITINDILIIVNVALGCQRNDPFI